MPSVSKKQHNLMAAVASNPAFAKKAGIPQRVGADFMKADKGRKFAKGGDMAKKMPPFMGKETKAEEAKEMKVKAKSFSLYKKGEKAEGVHGKSGKEKPTKYAAGGFTRAADGVAQKGKTKAKHFADGGVTEGQNVNIDDDTRARAMEAIRRRMAGEDDEKPAVAVKPRSAARLLPTASGRMRENVAPSGRGAAPGSFEDDKARMADMMRPGRDAIEKVYPEQLIGSPGGLGLKSLAGLASRLAGKGKSTGRGLAVREAKETPVTFLGSSGAKDITPKQRIGETSRSRLEAPPKRLSTSARKAEEDAFKGEGESFGLEGAFKRGGKIKTFAKGGAVRGGGCEVKGKTKGRII